MSAKRTILIVEDNKMNKILVRDILTLKGYDILEASTGSEAIKLLATERPDLILMDLHLPVMDGITAMRLIKNDKRINGIPVVAITASAMKGDEDIILEKGFDGYIPKPIEMDQLLFTIEGLLSEEGGARLT